MEAQVYFSKPEMAPYQCGYYSDKLHDTTGYLQKIGYLFPMDKVFVGIEKDDAIKKSFYSLECT